jgi:hypothetical protein
MSSKAAAFNIWSGQILPSDLADAGWSAPPSGAIFRMSPSTCRRWKASASYSICLQISILKKQ